jgi:hypothetical protein
MYSGGTSSSRYARSFFFFFREILSSVKYMSKISIYTSYIMSSSTNYYDIPLPNAISKPGWKTCIEPPGKSLPISRKRLKMLSKTPILRVRPLTFLLFFDFFLVLWHVIISG